MCYGVQWDAALNFIDSYYESGTATGYIKDSTNMGNYSESIATAGRDTAYQQKHIYDMAGNVWEWTMENHHADGRVIRGGSYYNIGSAIPASVRRYDSPDGSYDHFGFRITLFL